MARVDQPVRIKPVAYNNMSEPDPTLLSGENFFCNYPFLIVASKPIPRSSKVYFEFTVTKQIYSKSIRHVPIYVGLHKNPVMGILNTDLILAACYYTTQNSVFDIFERQQGDMTFIRHDDPRLKAKIPIVNTVIGFGVDTFENKLSLYSDGKLFYEFTSKLFDIDQSAEDTGEWYFALYSKLDQSLSGSINYGRYKVDYLPEGYCTLYQHYWDHEGLDIEIDPCTLTVDGTVQMSPRMYNFDNKIDVVNTYAEIDPLTKKRRPYLEHKTDRMNYEDTDYMYQMVAYRGSTYPDMSTINYPCPAEDTPVYIELTTRDATLIKDNGSLKYMGIPIEVGLTIKKNDFDNKSFRICLYHIKGGQYMTYSVYDGVQTYSFFPDLSNPALPVQPNPVGFIFDRKNNKISIMTEGSIFVEIPITGVDFSDWREDAYIFFKSADEVYTGYMIGKVETGEHPIAWELPDGVKTFYDYWNDSIRYYLEEPFPEFTCRMKVRIHNPHYHYDFISQLFVPRTKENSFGFENGLNMMWNSFNVVTDTEPHNNAPMMNFFEYNRMKRMDLEAHSLKKEYKAEFNCSINVENGYLQKYYLDVIMDLTKPVWYDLDCWMKVTLEPAVKIPFEMLLHGYLNYAKYNVLQNILTGFVSLDTNTTPGYPKYISIIQFAHNQTIDATWYKKYNAWDTESIESNYTRDLTVNPRFAVSVKPIPTLPKETQKANMEVFYNGASLGVQALDATTVPDRDFIPAYWDIPLSIYDPNSDHEIRITVENQQGCNFKGLYILGHIIIRATNGI